MWIRTIGIKRTLSLPAIAILLSIFEVGFSEEWRELSARLNKNDTANSYSELLQFNQPPGPPRPPQLTGRLHLLEHYRQRQLSERIRRDELKPPGKHSDTPVLRAEVERVAQVPEQIPHPNPPPAEVGTFANDARLGLSLAPGSIEAQPELVGANDPSTAANPLNAPSTPLAPQRKTDRLYVVQYDGVPLADAMKLFSDETGHNVICSAEAGKTEITVYLRDVAPLDALTAIVKANGLFFRADEESGIFRISTADEYEKDLASFREEQTRVFTLLYPNPVAVAQVVAQVFGHRVELNTADADRDDLDDLSQRFNRFDLVDGRSLGLGTFDNNAQTDSRLGRTGSFPGVQQQQGGFQQGMSLSDRSRSRTRQVKQSDRTLNNLAAAEIQDLEDQLAASGDISETDRARLMLRGEATIFVSTVRRNNQVVVRTSDPQSMIEIERLVAQLDVPTPTVLLEVKVLRIDLADGFNSAFEYLLGNDEAAAAFSDGNLAPNFPGASPVSRSLANGLGVAGAVPGALTFQIVDNNFQFRMQLLESESRVTALATPLILTANNEVSRIFVGDTLPFTVGFTPSQVVGGLNSVSGAVAATPITELRDVGQSLLITPSINADRTVTLRVVEENSERVLGGASIPVPAVDGGGVTLVQVDTVRRRTVSGTVVAQDGMAVALGGLIEEQVSDSKDQIPVLGNVPGLGPLFRRKSADNKRSELVVVIRPYVFNTPSESAATTQAVLGDLSIHPNAQDAAGTLKTYLPIETVRSNSECSERASLFRFHNVKDWD